MSSGDLGSDDLDGFDFVRECIETYRLAGIDVEQRIKALSLLKSVQPKAESVKDDTDAANRTAVQKAQAALRNR